MNTYDALIVEYYQLASKNVVFEAEMTEYDPSEHDEFVRLTDQIDELESELHGQDWIPAETDIRCILDVPGMRADGR